MLTIITVDIWGKIFTILSLPMLTNIRAKIFTIKVITLIITRAIEKLQAIFIAVIMLNLITTQYLIKTNQIIAEYSEYFHLIIVEPIIKVLFMAIR